MKFLLAFDSFKGCMSAEEACKAAARGVLDARPEAEVVECPLSDGGEGLVACLREVGGSVVRFVAHDPLMRPLEAEYVIDERTRTAYMEMAATSGLTLVEESERRPLEATTYGVGEMLVDAARRGVKRIVMGIGGSATTDAGEGMLEAIKQCGMQWHELPPITVACDVANPLYGPQGAAYVFAPQKGASAAQVEELDCRLRRFARQTESLGYATEALAMEAGTGAAGGLGYALLAYLKAELKSGIEVMLDIVGFDHLLQGATVVMTGEGRSDDQTLMGKVPCGVRQHCREAGVPVWLMSGSIDDASGQLSAHFDRVLSINEGDPRPLHTLMQTDVAMANMRKAARAVCPIE